MIFGLTGGIACGKSTIASFLVQLGVAVIDADRVAKDLARPGSEALQAIAQHFGKGVLTPDGALDRKGLGALIFGNNIARDDLNQIMHPRIRAAALDEAQALFRQGFPLVAYEAALLFETGSVDRFRPVVLVAANEQVQIERLSARDGLGHSAALARIRSQMPLLDKLVRADFVINNSATLEDARIQTTVVVAGLCEIAGVQPDALPSRCKYP